MCGIAGYLGNFVPTTLQHFTETLAHRGPDGEGRWHHESSGIGLAHRRLSIIDLSSAASQPMEAVARHGAGRYMVVFNGEIYNYKALQARLDAQGYAYNRNSDAGVLGPLYDLLGPAMLDELEGMFALAIWDRQGEELWLARDHAGIKPLYYAQTTQGLAFASELKALAGLPGMDLRPDAAALADYLTLLWSPGERTPVRGIKKLLPGHWLRARRAGPRVECQTVRWWWPPQAPLERGRPSYDQDLQPADLAALLDEVVAEQCLSDVPVGAFLSGGVDSSALVASMVANARAGRGPQPAMTYCIGFATGQGMAGEGFSDDLPHARAVAEMLGVPFTALEVNPAELLGRLAGLAAQLDEPTADPAPLFVQDICAQARRDGIPVLLSGTGGDDIMTGYRRHQTARLRQRLGPLRHPAALGLGLLGRLPLGDVNRQRRMQRLAPLLRGSDARFLVEAFKTNSLPGAWRLLKEEFRDELQEGCAQALTLARHESRGQDLVNRLLYQELFGFLPDHNLNYGDKASMASGVEVRVPLTDRRLIELMARVDPKKKLHGMRLKAFFKDAVRDRLPAEVITRSKAGFGAPMRSWLTGPGRGVMEGTLLGDSAARWFDMAALRQMWRQTCDGEVDGAYAMLAAAMLVWWGDSLGRPRG